MIIKQLAVRNEWGKHQEDSRRTLLWLTKGYQNRVGGIFLLKKEDFSEATSDDYLRVKYGTEENAYDPVMYGDIDLSENEKEAPLLRPKFALYEDVSVKGMGLQLRRAGVKMRWAEMEREDESGENAD